jgi:hypothetical protein
MGKMIISFRSPNFSRIFPIFSDESTLHGL